MHRVEFCWHAWLDKVFDHEKSLIVQCACPRLRCVSACMPLECRSELWGHLGKEIKPAITVEEPRRRAVRLLGKAPPTESLGETLSIKARSA